MKIPSNRPAVPGYFGSNTAQWTAVRWYQNVLSGDSRKFPNGFWQGTQGQINAAACMEYGLKEVLGLKFDRETRTIDPLLLERHQKTLLATKVNHPRKNWQNLFQEIRLLGCLSIPEFENSPALALMRSFPWAFDLNTDEGKHMHAWDFIVKDPWEGEKGYNLALTAIRHVFEKHLGIVMDAGTGTIDERMMPEQGTKFPEKYTRLPRLFGCTQWWELFEKEGIVGPLIGVERFNNKAFLALYHAYKWAFDLNTPEGKHLHPWDFVQTGLWAGPEGRELAKTALTHVICSHLGLRMVPPAPRTGQFAIDERLLNGDMRAFFSANGVSNWTELLNDRLLFVNEINNSNPSLPKSFHQTFKWIFPWAFCLGMPEGMHAHPWNISTEFDWVNERDVIDAVTHEVNRENWTITELPEKATTEWFKKVGLGGLLDRFSNRVNLFKFVYKEQFDNGTLNEADFPNLQTGGEKRPYKAIAPATSYGRKAAVFTMEGANYNLPAEYAGCCAQKMDDGIIGIFKKNPSSKTGSGLKLIGTIEQVAGKTGVWIKEKDIRKPDCPE